MQEETNEKEDGFIGKNPVLDIDIIKEDSFIGKNLQPLNTSEDADKEPTSQLLARLYDTAVALNLAEINTTTLENGRKVVIITLMDVAYSTELGFEESQPDILP